MTDRVNFGAGSIRQETVCRYGEQHCRLWCGAQISPLSVRLLPNCPPSVIERKFSKKDSTTLLREFKTQMQKRRKLSHTCICTTAMVRDRPDPSDGTACASCEICPKQDAGKRRIYQLAGVARAPGNTCRCRLIQVKGVPFLVPIR